MPFNYRESTTLSRQDALAVKSLAATGELPQNHYWNTLRARHDANPTRFNRANVVLGALLDRDQLQRQGVLSANAPLLPKGGFFSYAGAKHALNSVRFDHWHPFLGRLFDIKLPTTPAGQNLIPTTPTTTTPGQTIGGGNSGSTDPNQPSQLLPPGDGSSTGPGSPGVGPITNAGGAVPEPASAVMLGMALALVLGGMMFNRLARRVRSVAQRSVPA